jgi:hypothetical protein
MGFAFVASGPLVRSSYHAAEGFVAARLAPPGTPAAARTLDPARLSPSASESLLAPESLLRRFRVPADRSG